MNSWFIYGLIDPITLRVRYVGCTSQGLARVKTHRKRASGQLKRWLTRLNARSQTFEWVVLEFITPGDKTMLFERERWWIAYGRLSRWGLLNQTEGGEGRPGWEMPQSTKDKIGIGNKRRFEDPDYRAKAVERLNTPEVNAKKGRNWRGKKIPPEAIAKRTTTRRARFGGSYSSGRYERKIK